MSVVAVIAPPIRMPGGGDRGARRGLERADRDQDARRRRRRGCRSRRSPARGRCGTPLMRPPLVIAAVVTIAATNAIASSVVLEDERDQRADRGELHDRPRRGDQRSPAQPELSRHASPRRARRTRCRTRPGGRRRSIASQARASRRPRPRRARGRGWRRSRPGRAGRARRRSAAITLRGLGVQRGGRLVEQDRVGLARQRPRQRDAGALAAGQRLRGAREERGVEAGGGERRVAGVVGAAPRARRRGCRRPCPAASPAPGRRARRAGAARCGATRRMSVAVERRSSRTRARRGGSGSAAACSCPRRTAPTSASTWPRGAAKETSLSTTRSPRRTVRSRTSIPPFIPCSFTRPWP